MGRRVTSSEIIAQFHAACEGHDLQGRMPTQKQLIEWTGSTNLVSRIAERYGFTDFARMIGLEPNKRGFAGVYDSGAARKPPAKIIRTPSTYTIPPRKRTRPTCKGCEWVRDGQGYCVLPKCMKGANDDDNK